MNIKNACWLTFALKFSFFLCLILSTVVSIGEISCPKILVNHSLNVLLTFLHLSAEVQQNKQKDQIRQIMFRYNFALYWQDRMISHIKTNNKTINK